MGTRALGVVGGALGCIAVVLAVVVVVGPDRTVAGQPVAAVTGAPGVARETERSLDPCALHDLAAYSGSGSAAFVGELGRFESCSIDVTTADDVYRVSVTLWPAETFALGAAPADPNGVRVERDPSRDGLCVRRLDAGTDHQALVYTLGSRADSAESCAMADLAVGAAGDALVAGDLPRRPTPPSPDSLRRVDACDLLRPDDLTSVPGLPADRATPGFAGWSCVWGDVRTSANSAAVEVSFGSVREFAYADAGQFGNTRGIVEPGGDGRLGTCDVTLAHREYLDDRYVQAVEVVVLTVQLGPDASSERACEVAQILADDVSARRP